MPAESVAQQQAAGAALRAKRGKMPASKLRGASLQMFTSMSESQLTEMAGTPTKGLVKRKRFSRRKK